jgi:hypothetical protein
MKKLMGFTGVSVLLLGVLLASQTAAALTGAVFTTNVACDGTNVNIFTDKADVYLDGGPHHAGAASLPDGDYYVQVTIPSGALQLGYTSTASVHVTNGSFDQCYKLLDILLQTSDNQPGFDDTTNSGGVYKVWVCTDVAFENCKTDNFKVKNAPHVDSGSIFGTKWEDLNADGIFDGGEEGIPHWTINLFESNGSTFVASAITDIDGDYSFVGVEAGTYDVCENIPAGWFPSFPQTSAPNCHDDIVVTQGGNTLHIDFGNYRNATISGAKYEDMNGDGDLTDGVGLENWTINLGGDASATDNTSAIGGFSFSVKPGTYTVCETLVSGWMQTSPTATYDCGDGTFGYEITVISNEKSNHNDFGNFELGSIFGMKWFDANVSHTNDGEAALENWTINLYESDGTTLIASDLTNLSGNYEFSGLALGTYVVCESFPDSHWLQTFPESGFSCSNGTKGYEITINASGQAVHHKDFGNVCLEGTGGKTLGFWSNKNGEKTMNDGGTLAPELALLVGKNLRNGNGSNFDPASYSAFRTWLLNASATNMAYMLSAQFAATTLDVEAGLVDGTDMIFAPELYAYTGSNVISVNDLLTRANTELGLNGLVLSGNSNRTYQEALKNVLDKINNNLQIAICD